MADNAESAGDAQVTFKVKTSSDTTHTMTMAESATVLDLKTKLSGEDHENIPVERQRLIYSGRVMKNDDTLGNYKIKPNNTIHMVKSAASNPSQPPTTSAPTPQAIPTNMASGTANNPLAGLTGARYAGHQVNLPGMDMFGPDGGMGPPMDEERVQRMMSDPNVQQSMNEALNNPDFVNMLIESNPMLRNMPNAREIITSPFMRQMMSSPQMMSQAMRMQRNMRGGDSSFPAPGATDTSAEGAAAGEGGDAQANSNQQNPFMNPFMMPGMMGGAGAGGAEGAGNGMNIAQLLQGLNASGGNPFGAPSGGQQGTGEAGTGAGAATATGTGQTGAAESGSEGAAEGQRDMNTLAQQIAQAQAQAQGASGNQAGANPFGALFPPQGGSQGNPFGMNPEMMQQMMQMMGGGGGGAGAAPAPADNRPPEERYADQLRQLNDMGFYDFDRNVSALRRSGGSVQGAVEHLLTAMD